MLQLHQFQQSSAEVSLPTAVAVKDGKKKTEAYKRYAFTIGGIADLDQITALLLDFYQAGHLHKIHQLSLSPTSGARFNVSLSGEALGVATCDKGLPAMMMAPAMLEARPPLRLKSWRRTMSFQTMMSLNCWKKSALRRWSLAEMLEHVGRQLMKAVQVAVGQILTKAEGGHFQVEFEPA